MKIVDGAQGVILYMPAEGRHAAAHIQPGHHDTSDQLISNVVSQHRTLKCISKGRFFVELYVILADVTLSCIGTVLSWDGECTLKVQKPKTS